MYGCHSLVLSKEVLDHLDVLALNGCMIQYPAHWENRSSPSYILKVRLRAAIHNPLKKREMPRLEMLVRRLLNEAVEERGGEDIICHTIFPIVVFLENHQDHVFWIEEIASRSLDGCVNQPVHGLNAIVSWIHVAQAETFHDKIQALRYPFACALIDEIVLNYMIRNHQRGIAYQVEAANVLLREVYKKLHESLLIKNPWIGISEEILHENTVQSWFSQEDIAIFSKKIELLSDADFCKNVTQTAYYSIWGAIVCPDDMQIIYQRYELMMTHYDEFIGVLIDLRQSDLLIDNVLKDIPLEKHKDFIQFHETMKGLEGNALKKYPDILAQSREEELCAAIQKWTLDALDVLKTIPPVSDAKKDQPDNKIIGFKKI
jgi:hypothetical protein